MLTQMVTLFLLLNALLLPPSGASAPAVKHVTLATPAQTSELKLAQGASAAIHPLSKNGIVLTAIQTAQLLVNGERLALKAGSFKQLEGNRHLTVATASGNSVRLIVVNVRTASQPLTIQSTKVGRHKELEDASARNRTLLIAISSLRMSDRIDRSDLAGPHWGQSRTIALEPGKTLWLRPGIHRMQNENTQIIAFITVEW